MGITISKHGRDLLQTVARKRVACQGRPLVFVAHSLGGVLVKIALTEATRHPQDGEKKTLRDIGDSCKGIFFYGTPIRGSHLAKWGDILLNFTWMLPYAREKNKQVIQQLKFDSEQLDNTAREFTEYRKSSQVRIYNFLEGVPLSKPHG